MRLFTALLTLLLSAPAFAQQYGKCTAFSQEATSIAANSTTVALDSDVVEIDAAYPVFVIASLFGGGEDTAVAVNEETMELRVRLFDAGANDHSFVLMMPVDGNAQVGFNIPRHYRTTTSANRWRLELHNPTGAQVATGSIMGMVCAGVLQQPYLRYAFNISDSSASSTVPFARFCHTSAFDGAPEHGNYFLDNDASVGTLSAHGNIYIDSLSGGPFTSANAIINATAAVGAITRAAFDRSATHTCWSIRYSTAPTAADAKVTIQP